jgi:hypothetical protein
MRDELILSQDELTLFNATEDTAGKAHALLAQQKRSWDTLRNGYAGLASVETKVFEIDGFTCRVQFNPSRITSSSAKVDEKSIRERKCFLCPANLPEAQRGLKYDNDYIILCNPVPIFFEHFTIPHVQHIPQEIRSSFPALLKLSKDFSERYTVFYNGPKCGASAPDHLHFQAGEKGFMPIEGEYESVITGVGEKIADVDGLLGFAVGDFLRRFISFESDDALLLQKAFDVFSAIAQDLAGSDEEPMMNILSSYQDGEWRVIIFPRAKHRPSFFFEEGENRMVISPAAVDFGGVVITPVEKDFERITQEHLIQMFNEISVSEPIFTIMKDKLSSELSFLNPEA